MVVVAMIKYGSRTNSVRQQDENTGDTLLLAQQRFFWVPLKVRHWRKIFIRCPLRVLGVPLFCIYIYIQSPD